MSTNTITSLHTLDAVFLWNPRWSTADRAVILEQVYRLNIVGFVKTTSYWKAINGDNDGVMRVHRGKLDFKPDAAPRHAVPYDRYPWHYLLLSTYSTRTADDDFEWPPMPEDE